MLLEEAVTHPDTMAQMCAIGRSVDTGISALPSIIGPASAVFRPQKSQSTGGCPGEGRSSVVTLSTPDRNHCRNRNIYGRGTSVMVQREMDILAFGGSVGQARRRAAS